MAIWVCCEPTRAKHNPADCLNEHQTNLVLSYLCCLDDCEPSPRIYQENQEDFKLAVVLSSHVFFLFKPNRTTSLLLLYLNSQAFFRGNVDEKLKEIFRNCLIMLWWVHSFVFFFMWLLFKTALLHFFCYDNQRIFKQRFFFPIRNSIQVVICFLCSL